MQLHSNFFCDGGVRDVLDTLTTAATAGALTGLRNHSFSECALSRVEAHVREGVSKGLKGEAQYVLNEIESYVEESMSGSYSEGFSAGEEAGSTSAYEDGFNSGKEEGEQKGLGRIVSAVDGVSPFGANAFLVVLPASEEDPVPFACPSCHAALLVQGTKLLCSRCRQRFTLTPADEV